MKASVVIPVYNEINYIDEIIRRTVASPVEKEIIVVDDCSTDGTRARLEEIARQSHEHGVRVLFHERNRGKGAALRTGFAQPQPEHAGTYFEYSGMVNHEYYFENHTGGAQTEPPSAGKL